LIYAFIVLAAFTPVFLWIKFFHDRTGITLAPKDWWPAFLIGMFVTYPGILIQGYLSTSPQTVSDWLQHVTAFGPAMAMAEQMPYLVRTYVFAGLVEEALKFAALVFLVVRMGAARRPLSVMLVAVIVAGAFAGVENVLYCLSSDNWGRTALLRGLMSVPNHITLGAITGFFLALSFRGGWWRLNSALAFLVPSMLHGTTNYALYKGATLISDKFVMARPLYAALLVTQILFAVVAVAWIERYRNRTVGSEEDTGVTSMGPLRAQRGLRSGFWRRIAFILSIYGIINLVVVVIYPFVTDVPTNLTATFIVGGLSILYAVIIWGRARGPALARS
jgi:RsiW-degrading membrane proteinase PrsW (M82 family)